MGKEIFSELCIFGTDSVGFLYRVFFCISLHFCHDDFIHIQTAGICHKNGIAENISQLLFDFFHFATALQICTAPLIYFQKLGSFQT